MFVFIDGTTNTPKDNTNVYRLFKKYGGQYFSGPGTRAPVWDKVFGDVTYDWITSHLEKEMVNYETAT